MTNLNRVEQAETLEELQGIMSDLYEFTWSDELLSAFEEAILSFELPTIKTSSPYESHTSKEGYCLQFDTQQNEL